jgi:hypothetical protein
MRNSAIGLAIVAALLLSAVVRAQDVPMKVKGGHQLGETAEQFFAEGHEKGALAACAAGDFKSLNKSSRAIAKKYCAELTEDHQLAIRGKREEWQSGGDPTEMRVDTFTFDAGRLVKVELVYAVPSAESNYSGQTFEKIFAGVKEAYGTPTRESTKPVQDVYGASYIAHNELWLAPHAAIVITEKPGPNGSTTLVALTRAEYDRTLGAGPPKPANPLE